MSTMGENIQKIMVLWQSVHPFKNNNKNHFET